MKKLMPIILTAALLGCSNQTTIKQNSIGKIDSLSAQINELKEKYKPGLGEIMSGIQTHHAKLWYAGINENWKLATYEIKEIKERLKTAEDIETNRIETGDIPMIYGNLDSVLISIQQKKVIEFKNSFQLLTNKCNNCHRTVNFEFNVVKIPTMPPVTNQVFKVK